MSAFAEMKNMADCAATHAVVPTAQDSPPKSTISLYSGLQGVAEISVHEELVYAYATAALPQIVARPALTVQPDRN